MQALVCDIAVPESCVDVVGLGAGCSFTAFDRSRTEGV